MAIYKEDIVVNAEAEAFSQLCNNGYIRLYNENEQVLSELRLNKKAFNKPKSGVLKARKIKAGKSILEGNAVKYKVYQEDGKKLLLTGSVGKKDSNSDLQMDSTYIPIGAVINITEFIHIIPKETE